MNYTVIDSPVYAGWFAVWNVKQGWTETHCSDKSDCQSYADFYNRGKETAYGIY